VKGDRLLFLEGLMSFVKQYKDEGWRKKASSEPTTDHPSPHVDATQREQNRFGPHLLAVWCPEGSVFESISAPKSITIPALALPSHSSTCEPTADTRRHLAVDSASASNLAADSKVKIEGSRHPAFHDASSEYRTHTLFPISTKSVVVR
jgi:hypothetical protein